MVEGSFTACALSGKIDAFCAVPPECRRSPQPLFMSLFSQIFFCCSRPRSDSLVLSLILEMSMLFILTAGLCRTNQMSGRVLSQRQRKLRTLLDTLFFCDFTHQQLVISPAQHHVVVDQQRMKERLGVIVRSKEGCARLHMSHSTPTHKHQPHRKMVNVNASLPFNLHNKALHGRLDPSSSRSARGPSPQPSVDTAQTSSSASRNEDEEARRPVLNVKIVRGVSAFQSRRGRPNGRGPRVSAEGSAAAAATGDAGVKSYAEVAKKGTQADASSSKSASSQSAEGEVRDIFFPQDVG